MSLVSSLLDLERTGPELCCSNKMPAYGKQFSSEPWKFLILVRAIHVQLCFAVVEKKNYTEIWAQKGFVTTCFEKRCLKLWKACMEFLFCTQIQKSAKLTPWLQERQRSLSSKEWAVLLGSNRAEALERHLLLTERISPLCKPHSIILQIEQNGAESLHVGTTWLQKSWLLTTVTQVLTPSLRISHPAFKDSYQPKRRCEELFLNYNYGPKYAPAPLNHTQRLQFGPVPRLYRLLYYQMQA